MDHLNMELSDLEHKTVSGGGYVDHENDWKRIFRKMKDENWSYERVMKYFERYMSTLEYRALFTGWINEVFEE